MKPPAVALPLLLLSLLLVSVGAQDPKDELDAKRLKAVEKGISWLLKNQDAGGAFARMAGDKKFPSVAYTALALNAIKGSGVRGHEKEIAKAEEFLIKNQNEDGSFSEKGGFFKTYCTALAVVALSGREDGAAAGDRRLNPYGENMRRALDYLAKSQVKEGVFEGGFGYMDLEPSASGVKQLQSADLSNTGFAAEALKHSIFSGPDDKKALERIIKFVQKCQNTTEVKLDPVWAKLLEENGFKTGNDGGAYYAPIASEDASKAGTTKGSDGKEVFNSYASMTYEALKTYLYAGLSKDDPRVVAAVSWIKSNYSVDYHPGFPFDGDKPAEKRRGLQGLYYYYLVMARALQAYGESELKLSDGSVRNWRNDIVGKLVKLQKPEGYWVNDNPRWWENDPVLVTCYAVTALNNTAMPPSPPAK